MLLHTTGLGLFLQLLLWTLLLPIILAVGIIWLIVQIVLFCIDVHRDAKASEAWPR